MENWGNFEVLGMLCGAVDRAIARSVNLSYPEPYTSRPLEAIYHLTYVNLLKKFANSIDID
ncbi:MAG: hypothetical protein EAZ18_04785 [Oscillatoriales cyanobacterium]|nr:MAG: hypothetical protein EAZ18_04785 [Oscillatoriales cyanobacterium]